MKYFLTFLVLYLVPAYAGPVDPEIVRLQSLVERQQKTIDEQNEFNAWLMAKLEKAKKSKGCM